MLEVSIDCLCICMCVYVYVCMLADHMQSLTRSVHDNTANIHMPEVRLFFVNCLCVCMYVCMLEDHRQKLDALSAQQHSEYTHA